ncbi:MAG: zinc ABC transporter substrate-binding protein [Methanolobus sp.]|nr:zinc ABC transporter substrate-binding protein [Methanolobus sp.]
MKKTLLALTMLLLICIILTAGCADEQNISGTASDSMVVAVSILPQVEFVEKIAGDNVEVIVMVPPGASPHSYEPTPSQLTSLSKAQMYAMVGSGITVEDALMGKIAGLNPDMMIVDCSAGIKLVGMEPHSHGDEDDHDHEHEAVDDHDHEHEAVDDHDHDHTGLDPHIWTSPDNVKVMVENIYNGLVALDPENEATYLENKNAYLAELDALDAEIRTTLSGKEGSSFMVYHPAWGYFANHYGLIQVPVEIEGKEPSVSDMKNVIDLAKEKGIKVVFVQTGFSTVSASAIANEIGGEVVEIDPLAKDYIGNLAKVAEAFEKGLA